MRHHVRYFRAGVILFAALSMIVSGPPLAAQGHRPLSLDDILANESIQEIAQSPTRDEAIVVVNRGRTDAEVYLNALWDDERRSDLWLLDAHGGLRNFTEGVRDGSSWFRPVWSPDGERLALLSTRGGDNLRPYLWERESGTFVRLTEEGVNWRGHLHPGNANRFQPMTWLDEHTLLVSVVAPGSQSWDYRGEIESRRLAADAWSRVPGGTESTAGVLRGGSRARPMPVEAEGGALLRIDLRSGTATRLIEGDVRHVLIAPDGLRAAVILLTGTRLPEHGRPIVQWDMWASRLALVDLTGGTAPIYVDEVPDPRLGYTGVPHRWSPDSRHLAVFSGWAPPGEVGEGGLHLVGRDGAVRRVTSGAPGGATAVDWSPLGRLLVRSAPGDGGRADWWELDPTRLDARGRNLTALLPSVPAELVRFTGNRWIGVAGGRLHALGYDGESHEELELPGYATTIVWPSHAERLAGPADRLILSVRGDDAVPQYVIVQVSRSGLMASRVPRPHPRGLIRSHRAETGFSTFRAVTPEGSFLWAGSPEDPELALHLNAHLRNVEEAEKRLVEYRSMEGEELTGLLLLPRDREPGARLPIVTVAYAGDMVRDTTGWFIDINHTHYLNWQLFTAHGYGVLVPSIPIPAGERADQFLEIPKGVLPAVEKVVEMGIADPNRIALFGQSHGGYTVYALIAFTRRFRAAIATHGNVNLISSYGLFDARARYSGGAVESVGRHAQYETGQGQLGVPPYEDFWRYMRNSPLLFVDRIETPLMLIYGDNDSVGMPQGEEIFTALHRMGRPVEFVRFWGEGHGVVSPANMRAYWQRMLDWLDEHLGMGEVDR